MVGRPFDFERIVIGSGFGGAVAALRLSEQGYRVCVLEQGRRWEAGGFPASNWNLLKYLWQPALGLRGFVGTTITRRMIAVHGNGVGGGSLVYANALPVPDEAVFAGPEWILLRPDWWQTLRPFYALAQRMMGAAAAYANGADRTLHRAAIDQGTDGSGPAPIAVLEGPSIRVSSSPSTRDAVRHARWQTRAASQYTRSANVVKPYSLCWDRY
jgi:choline dehydrogenase-like flavoprotein